MKILFTTPLLEHPPAGGPFLRIENSIKALNQICELHIISRTSKSNIGGEKADFFYKKLCKNFLYAPSISEKKNNFITRLRIKLLTIFNKVFYGELHFYEKFILKLDAKFIINYALQNKINVIWFGYGSISHDLIKLIKKMNPELKLIYDTDSVMSRFILRKLPYEKDPVKIEKIKNNGIIKQQEESDLVKICDIITAVSREDANYYSKFSSDTRKIKLFSNVIDVDTYSVPEKLPLKLDNNYVLISGYFGPDSPMEHASRWFINDVMPLIRSEYSNIHLLIAGRNADTVLHDIKNSDITILGKVESMLPFLQNASVALVPLHFESGTRFKILEAGACSIPIVSTTLGAEGLDLINQKQILIADTPKTFAASVINILSDKDFAKKMAKRCNQFIINNHGIESLKKEGLKIIEAFK